MGCPGIAGMAEKLKIQTIKVYILSGIPYLCWKSLGLSLSFCERRCLGEIVLKFILLCGYKQLLLECIMGSDKCSETFTEWKAAASVS